MAGRANGRACAPKGRSTERAPAWHTVPEWRAGCSLNDGLSPLEQLLIKVVGDDARDVVAQEIHVRVDVRPLIRGEANGLAIARNEGHRPGGVAIGSFLVLADRHEAEALDAAQRTPMTSKMGPGTRAAESLENKHIAPNASAGRASNTRHSGAAAHCGGNRTRPGDAATISKKQSMPFEQN